MKLEKIAKKAIEIIQEAGDKGVGTAVLAKELNVPKRRIYDVNAIMKAAGLIRTSRDRTGTTIYWKDASAGSNVNKIGSNKIKVSTPGIITKVSNSSNEVVIESTSTIMNVETA
ncbi:MAG: hypothetical protein ACXAE3_00160 [Candidatus Kariarchaeaceae archaeon]|jgi:hypothetical protein